MEVILSHKYCKGLVTTIKSGWGKGEGGLTTLKGECIFWIV